jgi:hypothetical protein
LGRNRGRAVPVLAALLTHPDPGWRVRAATALGRLGKTPPKTLPDLLLLLRGEDAEAKVAALTAIESLPVATRDRDSRRNPAAEVSSIEHTAVHAREGERSERRRGAFPGQTRVCSRGLGVATSSTTAERSHHSSHR